MARTGNITIDVKHLKAENAYMVMALKGTYLQKRQAYRKLNEGGVIMKFLKTKYYPVDMDNRLIILDPMKREKDLAWKYKGQKGIISLKGDRLNSYSCYKSFVTSASSFLANRHSSNDFRVTRH